MSGTARSIGNDRGGFAGADDDIRDQYLRVTLRIGLETFLPMRELIAKVPSGEFVEYDWTTRETF
jgi:hypothetical protein